MTQCEIQEVLEDQLGLTPYYLDHEGPIYPIKDEVFRLQIGHDGEITVYNEDFALLYFKNPQNEEELLEIIKDLS
jgi:hypothetical protein